MSEEERIETSGGAEGAVEEAALGGVGEVPLPPGGRSTPEEGEGGASNELRTKMEGMEVGGDEMDASRGVA